MNKILILIFFTTSIFTSSLVFSEEDLYVFTHKPPANIRLKPQGKLYCEIKGVSFIATSKPKLDYKKNKWYPIEACGKNGYIHQSEVIAFSDFSDLTTDQLLGLSKKGNHIAQLVLGKRYRHGTGVKKNAETALMWLKKSANQGNKRAKSEVTELVQDMAELEEESSYMKQDNRLSDKDFDKYEFYVSKAPSFLRDTSDKEIICTLKVNQFITISRFGDKEEDGWHRTFESCGDDSITVIHESQLQVFNEKSSNDKKLARELLSQDGGYLGRFSDDIKDDKEIVIAAIESGDRSIIHASERLRGDRSIALKAVENNILSLLDIDPRFKKDKKFIGKALKDVNEEDYLFLVNSVDAKATGYMDGLPNDAPEMGTYFLEMASTDSEVIADARVLILTNTFDNNFKESVAKNYSEKIHKVKTEKVYKVFMDIGGLKEAKLFFNIFYRNGFEDVKLIFDYSE